MLNEQFGEGKLTFLHLAAQSDHRLGNTKHSACPETVFIETIFYIVNPSLCTVSNEIFIKKREKKVYFYGGGGGGGRA